MWNGGLFCWDKRSTADPVLIVKYPPPRVIVALSTTVFPFCPVVHENGEECLVTANTHTHHIQGWRPFPMLGKERKSTAVLPCSKFPGMHAHQQLVCNIASV